MNEQVTAIVLAAGAGTRMKSDVAKVLHPIGGRSMVGHALTAVAELGAAQTVVVVGHQRDQVTAHVEALDLGVTFAHQVEQNGTGHAVQIAVEALAEAPTGTVLVTYGDVPLLESATLANLLADHRDGGRAVTILSSAVDDPTGYGRIVRDMAGNVVEIREDKDADAEIARIDEINSGILALDAAFLLRALPRLSTQNAQGELYLTDVVGLAVHDGHPVGAYVLADTWQTEGVNDRAQLARLGGELNRRIIARWHAAGVTITDPASTWIDAGVEIGPDTTIAPGTQLLGATTVGAKATIGPDTTLTDCEVGDAAHLVRTHANLAVIGADASVGPFAYLRPGTRIDGTAKVGTFVETKNAHLHAGAKVPHLSYVGDAEIGASSNIGAGTIFANYDGQHKHRTTVGTHAKTGSNNTFVAPVAIGDGAFTGAGTTVRQDVPPGALAVSAGPQRTIEGWVVERRPGSPAAQAACDAEESGD